MENSNHTLQELNEFLAYTTRIASFKSNSDYIPFITSYVIKEDGDIKQSFCKHYKENIELTTNGIKIGDIKNDLLTYFDFLKSNNNQIGFASGKDIYQLIEDEAQEFIKSGPEYEWVKIYSKDTNISMSTIGNVYATKINNTFLIVDIGYSD